MFEICSDLSKIGLKVSTFKKGQKMATWPNHFIPGKQFLKRPNLADLAFNRAKWQPCSLPFLS